MTDEFKALVDIVTILVVAVMLATMFLIGIIIAIVFFIPTLGHSWKIVKYIDRVLPLCRIGIHSWLPYGMTGRWQQCVKCGKVKLKETDDAE